MRTRPRRFVPESTARAYFGAQAGAGVVWWVAVFVSDDVRRWTLGGWDPALLVVPDLLLFAGASAVAAACSNRVAAAVSAVWTVGVTVALASYGLVAREAGAGVVLMAVAALGTVAATATLWTGGIPTKWFFIGPFVFRVARDGSSARHLARSLVQLVVFWSTFFLLVPLVLSWVERRLRMTLPALADGWAWVGGGLFAVGSVLGLWSCVTMALVGRGTPLPAETARQLVVAGPYRFVRNPMALAGVVQTIGVGLWIGSWIVVVVALAGAVVWDRFIRPEEESDLLDRFGASYSAYEAAVRCWVPTERVGGVGRLGVRRTAR